jgi:cytochrome c peroxidase
VRLGRWLFFDRRLSADRTISCASCHEPKYGLSQSTSVATGIGGQKGHRKVPPVFNLAMAAPPVNFKKESQTPLFWDGRATSLERQMLEPVVNPVDTKERIAKAIADYERTLMSGNSPFDRWQTGQDKGAISEAAKQGFELFVGKADCAHCHNAPSFAGGFHNTGIGWNARTRSFTDLGHYAVTKGTDLEDWPGTFKTPTLREASRRAPYMHDGSIATLHDVVEYYNRGGNRNPDISVFVHPLRLTPQEVDAIVEFLETLNGEGGQDNGPRTFPQ